MCGICGICNYREGDPVDEALLRSITERMTHRGPDDSGLLVDGDVGLGVRRLSVIDLVTGGQPARNEDGSVCVVSNGEIYNFRELRRELEARGHRFRSRSDTEVIAHGYEQWGIAALGRLDGMFALAVWDARRRLLLVARDPFGIKPLYYADDGRALVFASEIRALLRHPGVGREVDPAAVREYLELTYVPAPRTAFAGIRKLLPGYALVSSAAEPVPKDVAFHAPAPDRASELPAEELTELLAEEIRAAVIRQTVSDVPVGVLLSGGMDSTAVATIVAEASGRVETFTAGFEGPFASNELQDAAATARRLGSTHHEVVLSPGEYLELLPTVMRHLEEPVSNPSAVPYLGVTALASSSVTVVLTGQGADEPFAGYARYLAERYGAGYRALPRTVRDGLIAPVAERLPRAEWLKRAVQSVGTSDPAVRLRRTHTIASERLVDDLLARRADRPEDALARWHAQTKNLDRLNRMLYVDARTVLADNLLLFGDKLAMAVSVEARMPFLDLELMALAERIPARLKIRRATRKWILRRALRRWVPHEVLNRPKIGFVTPVDQWLRNGLRPAVTERLLDPGSACREWFRADAVRRVLEEHGSGRHDHKRLLFALLAFEVWHSELVSPPRSAL
jgi:asparagine synthase (glutamine-hydrolysing)